MYRNYILLLLSLLHTACQTELSTKDRVLTQACDYLWSQQESDGGWHSQTHGILKGGESFTAFILWSLLEVPTSIYPTDEAKVKKALDFIRAHIREGRLGMADPMILDYPNYSTAYALRLLHHHGTAEDASLIQKLGDYLLAQQFNETRGIDSTHLAYGAWGFGETNLQVGRHGHVDLSHTRRVLEALQKAGRLSRSSKQQAAQFLGVLQKVDLVEKSKSFANAYDGGFFASSVTIATNKSELEIPVETDSMNYFSSYATATCDGLLALKTLEDESLEQRIAKATDWLMVNAELKYPQGIPHDTTEQWHEVMRYYHLLVRAEAFHTMAYQGAWQKEMVEILAQEQRADGSFSNPMGAPNKEDDPLLATAFAIVALQKTVL